MLTIVGDRGRGLELGVDEYLIKPFSMEEFLAKTCSLLKKKENYGDATKGDYDEGFIRERLRMGKLTG